jgi:hypothetical protein
MWKNYYSACRLSAIFILLAALTAACNGPSKKAAREGVSDFADSNSNIRNRRSASG